MPVLAPPCAACRAATIARCCCCSASMSFLSCLFSSRSAWLMASRLRDVRTPLRDDWQHVRIYRESGSTIFKRSVEE